MLGFVSWTKNQLGLEETKKSLIDHITTNLHPNFDNITTTPPGLSDPSMMIFNVRTTENIDNPKYHFTQNWDNSLDDKFQSVPATDLVYRRCPWNMETTFKWHWRYFKYASTNQGSSTLIKFSTIYKCWTIFFCN